MSRFAGYSFFVICFRLSVSLRFLSVFLFYFGSFVSGFLSAFFRFYKVWTNLCVAASNKDATVLIFQCLDELGADQHRAGESVLFIFLRWGEFVPVNGSATLFADPWFLFRGRV